MEFKTKMGMERNGTMNYFDLKKLKIKIEKQKRKVAKIRERSTSITQKLSGMPHSGNVSDNVGNAACLLYDAEQVLDKLQRQLDDGINSISDEYIREIIDAKINHNFSWTKIAVSMGGNNTGDSVRMMCTRYKW